MRDVQEELWKVYESLDPEDKALKLKALELISKMAPDRPEVKPEGRDASLVRAMRKVAGEKG